MKEIFCREGVVDWCQLDAY